jgi:hypothetical protein
MLCQNVIFRSFLTLRVLVVRWSQFLDFLPHLFFFSDNFTWLEQAACVKVFSACQFIVVVVVVSVYLGVLYVIIYWEDTRLTWVWNYL